MPASPPSSMWASTAAGPGPVSRRLARMSRRLARWITPLRFDAALAVVLGFLAAAETTLSLVHHLKGGPGAVSGVLGVAASAGVAWRRRSPFPTALLVAVAWGIGLVVIATTVPNRSGHEIVAASGELAALILLYSVVRYGRGRQPLLGGGAMVVVLSLANEVGQSGGFSPVRLLLPAVFFCGFAAAAVAVRFRASLREERVEQARTGEREQLARELHDVVAHHVSAMVVQASAALTVLDDDPAAARTALEFIKGSGTETLHEMRRMVGILRAGETELVPQAGLDALPMLVERAPWARVHVVLREAGTALPVDSTVGGTVYRIVQEAITNVRRHGRGVTTVAVELHWSDDQVAVEVRNDGAPVAALDPDQPGYGLVGMAERTRLVGGRFAAGPAPGGGWRVMAELPVQVRSTDGAAADAAVVAR